MRKLLCLIGLSLVGCSDYFGSAKDARAVGESVGAYAISAQADPTSTCAEIINAAPRPWTFAVSLRKEGETAYWFSSAEPVVGTLDKAGTLSFKTSTRTLVHDVDKKRELGACAIVRIDEFVGKVSEDKQTLTGTLRYAYQMEPGSDCRDIVGPVAPERPSPQFSVMPCDARFAVSATRTGEGLPPR